MLTLDLLLLLLLECVSIEENLFIVTVRIHVFSQVGWFNGLTIFIDVGVFRRRIEHTSNGDWIRSRRA